MKNENTTYELILIDDDGLPLNDNLRTQTIHYRVRNDFKEGKPIWWLAQKYDYHIRYIKKIVYNWR